MKLQQLVPQQRQGLEAFQINLSPIPVRYLVSNHKLIHRTRWNTNTKLTRQNLIILLLGGVIAAVIMGIVALVAIVVAATLYWKRQTIFKNYALRNDNANSSIA